MPKVFISHSFEDQEEFRNLSSTFRAAEIDVWDPDELLAGSPLSDQLRVAIEDCVACIFLATKRSIQSQWCLAELGAFWGTGKKVVIYLADRDLESKDLPPQFHGNVWTHSLPKVLLAVEEVKAMSAKRDFRPRRIAGMRLFQHKGYYPIDLEEETNRPILNAKTYVKALDYLLETNMYDRLAAMDLVYLRVDNLQQEPDILSTDTDLAKFTALINKYELELFRAHFVEEKERVFRNARRIVNDFGMSLAGTLLEIVLHDVRNPIHSIIAARNTEEVSGRKVGDPSTRFVVNYVRNQGRDLIEAMEGGSKIAYLKKFTRTNAVKATTTPIYDDLYGLVGILCLNIDIEAAEKLDQQQLNQFYESFKRHTGQTPAFEL